MADDETKLPSLRDAGMSFISRAGGFETLKALLDASVMDTIVLPFDLKDLARFYPEAPGLCAYTALLSDDELALRSHGTHSSGGTRPSLDQEFVAPTTDSQKRIALIVRNALSLDRVGINDNFFELGGDSVIGNQILIDIQTEFQIEFDINSIFEDFSISNIASLIERERRVDGISRNQ